MIKVYEKVLDGTERFDHEDKERTWTLDDVANAYRKVMTISSQNSDIDRYTMVSTKLSELYHQKLKNLDMAVEVLSERILFLENQSDSHRVKETYTDIISLLNNESQTNDLDERKAIYLCNALEKVKIRRCQCYGKNGGKFYPLIIVLISIFLYYIVGLER